MYHSVQQKASLGLVKHLSEAGLTGVMAPANEKGMGLIVSTDGRRHGPTILSSFYLLTSSCAPAHAAVPSFAFNPGLSHP